MSGHAKGSHVDTDIEAVLRGKSVDELDRMEEQVNDKINGDASVDVEYWETLLRKLKVQKARAKLREFHASLLRQHLEALELGGVDAFGRSMAVEDEEGGGEPAAGEGAAGEEGE